VEECGRVIVLFPPETESHVTRRRALVALPFLATFATVVSQTVSSDKDWKAQAVSLKGTPEAEFIIRVGDVDNLGFGWPEKFDPFCGRMTESHPYPWPINNQDVAGFDRMLVSSKFDPRVQNRTCGGDGYSSSQDPAPSRPAPYVLPIDLIKGATIRDAYLQMFIDDFQAPIFCSKFQVTLNGTRFVEAERVLNAIEQTGPVGKLVTLRVPEEFYSALSGGGRLELRVDDVNGAADGFAFDFLRLVTLLGTIIRVPGLSSNFFIKFTIPKVEYSLGWYFTNTLFDSSFFLVDGPIAITSHFASCSSSKRVMLLSLANLKNTSTEFGLKKMK
jgi:hypothetical protein